jgi:subtilase family serine protease
MAAGKPISLKPISIKDLEPDKVQIHLFPDGTFKAKCRYTVGVSIDPANTVSESNESNNSDNMAW